MNTKNIGNIGEHLAIIALLKLDVHVSKPIGDNSRYDLIIEHNGFLFKVQVKSTQSLKEGALEFNLCSTNYVDGSCVKKYYAGEVDFFILVDIKTQQVFACLNDGRKSIRLREENIAKTGTISNLYSDFSLEKILAKLS